MISSVSQKVDTELGQAPTSQATPRDTDHLLPSNLAARTLSLVEHTLSKFGGDPCPVRRGIAGSGEVLCEKITFFRLLLNRTREARALCGFQHHKGITCFVFCFWNDNFWPNTRASKIHTKIDKSHKILPQSAKMIQG